MPEVLPISRAFSKHPPTVQCRPPPSCEPIARALVWDCRASEHPWKRPGFPDQIGSNLPHVSSSGCPGRRSQRQAAMLCFFLFGVPRHFVCV